MPRVTIYPKSHYVTPRERLLGAMDLIKDELTRAAAAAAGKDRLLEAQRLEQRTNFDMEMIRELGYCSGIENYSRYLSGRETGEPPPTLFDYLPENAMLVVDESHVTIPQLGGMYKGDRSRKETLVEYGFRLPSALDNRPLRFDEYEAWRPRPFLSRPRRGPTNWTKPARWSSRWCGRPGWSTRRSRSARSAARSMTCCRRSDCALPAMSGC